VNIAKPYASALTCLWIWAWLIYEHHEFTNATAALETAVSLGAGKQSSAAAAAN